MWHFPAARAGLMLALVATSVLFAPGCSRPGGRHEGRSRGEGLSPTEERDATEIASKAAGVQVLRRAGKLYLTDVELFRDKDAARVNPSDRRAVVSFYRYEGDLTILSVVDLRSRRVVQIDSIPHVPTPLSQEEFQRAKDLALALPGVRSALGEDQGRVHIEALLSRSSSERDPAFSHRVVRLLFRRDHDYLTHPIVEVDLTTGQVRVDRGGTPR